ncbi:hypothetical protein BKA67DRAFT_571099 [Truncatella angustata]|uniref:Uncharacterized protein n=1 Tax=Truncatella angustata TaxID=152316 RepID=A0A9P8UG31_9PEZI|nr:uncharacterized protein BKA67DRAFT_571099 [Truncatella angustata]KAH6651501.1 hypothetical protein BKA67DRAFT_571099 [Truncatella angustata]KAH8203795.1 hypothetical protein TruAng_002088 [Truncatella angustata]
MPNFGTGDQFNRSTYETELAFIYNDGADTSTVQVKFSNVVGMTPYILDAWTGIVSPVLHYSLNGTSIIMPITLAPNQTTIIAFGTSANSSLPPSPTAIVTSISDSVIDLSYSFSNTSQVLLAYLSGEKPASITLSTGETRYFNTTEPPEASNLTTWDISIQDWHAADDIYSMETVIDTYTYNSSSLATWVDIDPVVLTNISGIGQYATQFTTPVFVGSTGYLGARLHLGPVSDSVRVWVNGARLLPVEAIGGVSDVVINIPTAYMVASGGVQANELRIEVATTLYNRIRADMDTVMTLGRPVTYTNAAYFEANSAKSYGLVGPVWIEWLEVVEVL